MQSNLSSLGGKMLHAFEITQIECNNNEEVHILEFRNEKCFEEYKVKTNTKLKQFKRRSYQKY